MADLKSFISRNNAALVKELTSAPKPDQTQKRRDVLVTAVDRTLEQIKAGEQQPKRGFYKLASDGEHFLASVRAGRSIMPIEGHSQIVLTRDQLAPFYQAVREEAKSGSLDKDMARAYESAQKPKRKPKA